MKPQFSHFTLFETLRTTFESMLSWFLYAGEASSFFFFLAVCRLIVRENIWCTKFGSRLSLLRDFISSDPLTLYDVTAVAGLLRNTQQLCEAMIYFFFQMNALPGWMPPNFSYLIRRKNWIHTVRFLPVPAEKQPSWEEHAHIFELWDKFKDIHHWTGFGAKPGQTASLWPRCSYRVTCTQQTSCRTQVC